MEHQRKYFVCMGCGLGLYLMPMPEMRNCICGGHFIEVEPTEIITDFPRDRKNFLEEMPEELINQIVEESMPGIYEGFDKLLGEEL